MLPVTKQKVDRMWESSGKFLSTTDMLSWFSRNRLEILGKHFDDYLQYFREFITHITYYF